MTTATKPPVTATQHPIPFQLLQPADFERFCLWLVAREGFEQVEHLGSLGHDQGCDILAMHGSERWAFQCKRVTRFGPRDVKEEIDKILTLPKGTLPVVLVFIVTCLVSAQTRKAARNRCMGKVDCIFWARTELDEKVNRHPDLLRAFFLLSEATPRKEEDSFTLWDELSRAEQIQHLLNRIDNLIALQTQSFQSASLDKAGPVRAHLLICDAHGSPIMYEHLTSTSIIVGRGGGTTVRIPDPELSASHLAIEILGSFLFATDLESTNGTRIKGELITRRTVFRFGDKISIGSHILIFYPPSSGDYSLTPRTSPRRDAS